MTWLDLSRTKTELFRLKKNVAIKLCVSETLMAKEAKLYLEVDEFTISRKLTLRKWEKSAPEWDSVFDNFYEFTPTRGGSYKFKVTDTSDNLLLEGFFSCENDKNFDSERIVTLMPKFIPGDYGEWSKLIENCSKHGYSSVHFTPLQKIGFSGSPYCIADQLQFERGGRKDLGR